MTDGRRPVASAGWGVEGASRGVALPSRFP